MGNKIWTEPRLWDIGEFNTDTKMQDISNDLSWLKDRPYDTKRATNTGANAVQAMTGAGNWFAINDAVMTMTVTTSVANERILVWMNGAFLTNGTIGQQMFWDILIDDTNYASSGAPTAPLGLGLVYQMMATANFNSFHLQSYITIPAAGVHTLKPRWAGTNAITFTMALATSLQLATLGALDI